MESKDEEINAISNSALLALYKRIKMQAWTDESNTAVYNDLLNIIMNSTWTQVPSKCKGKSKGHEQKESTEQDKMSIKQFVPQCNLCGKHHRSTCWWAPQNLPQKWRQIYHPLRGEQKVLPGEPQQDVLHKRARGLREPRRGLRRAQYGLPGDSLPGEPQQDALQEPAIRSEEHTV